MPVSKVSRWLLHSRSNPRILRYMWYVVLLVLFCYGLCMLVNYWSPRSTFPDTSTGFPGKCRPRNERKKSSFLCPIRDKNSNELWKWFVKSSIPEALLPVLENVHHRQFYPTRMTFPGKPRMIEYPCRLSGFKSSFLVPRTYPICHAPI